MTRSHRQLHLVLDTMTSHTQVVPRLHYFSAGPEGPWRIERITGIAGDVLPAAPRLRMTSMGTPLPSDAVWTLRGIVSNERYVERAEKHLLASRQEALGRPSSICAALIPIRKSAAWWGLAQDERRQIFEAQSHHIEIGTKYLPAIARRLHHCRDLAQTEPFDFLTWFEYAPAHAAAFDELLEALRASPEWQFVDREVDIRLSRADT